MKHNVGCTSIIIILVTLMLILYIKIFLVFDWNSKRIDFDIYDEQNIFYEYGVINNTKDYLYNTKLKKTYRYSYKKTSEEEIERYINAETGEEYYIDYDENNKTIGIASENIKNKSKRYILLWDELKRKNKSFYGFDQLLYIDSKKQLFFWTSISNQTLVKYDLIKNTMSEVLEYKSIYSQYYTNRNYMYNNNKIFVIDLNSQISIYDTIEEKLYETGCFAYNFVISNEGKLIYYISIDNDLCVYDLDKRNTKRIVRVNNRVERIDVDKNNNFILLVETLPKNSWIGVDTSTIFKQNVLNIYEISTGKHQIIRKSGLFKVIFNARFVDHNLVQ